MTEIRNVRPRYLREDAIRRAVRLRELMNDRIAREPDWSRDQKLQRFLAQAQTGLERARTLCILMNNLIARRTVLRP
jgi:hypothetical protein